MQRAKGKPKTSTRHSARDQKIEHGKATKRRGGHRRTKLRCPSIPTSSSSSVECRARGRKKKRILDGNVCVRGDLRVRKLTAGAVRVGPGGVRSEGVVFAPEFTMTTPSAAAPGAAGLPRVVPATTIAPSVIAAQAIRITTPPRNPITGQVLTAIDNTGATDWRDIPSLVAYAPGNVTDWTAPPPSTVGQALDRVAALLASVRGGQAKP